MIWLNIRIQDPSTSNWWVQYGEKINIGYWPAELFDLLRYHAECAEWGGEVYSSKLGQSPHTSTGMGNGHFPDYVSGNSGSIKRMRIRDNSLILKIPAWAYCYVDEYCCYNGDYIREYVEDPEFYYGGPGRNSMCPWHNSYKFECNNEKFKSHGCYNIIN